MESNAPTQERKKLYGLLGDLPPRQRLVSSETIRTETREGYVLETLVLDINGIEGVPAYLARPEGNVTDAPAILYNHAHGGDYELGKEELIHGRSALQSPPYARALTDLGYCVLCIDAWNFGERRGRTELELFKEMLWKGRVLWGMMVYDSLRAVDYLLARPEVDPTRLGTLGLSMGSTMAWWLAALDERVKVCVDICCLTDFHELIRTRGLDGHGIYYYVPDLLKHFDTARINAVRAAGVHLAVAGNYDPLTPPAGLDKVDEALKKVYADHGTPEKWKLLRYDTAHFETAHGRAAILEFLQRWL